MAKSKIHVGLEIGTSKTCMVVGELYPNGATKILGMGEVKTAGVRKGEVYDIHQATNSVIEAWSLAQEHADVDIISVFVSVTGAHIHGFNNRGTYALPRGQEVIKLEHIDEVNDLAQDVPVEASMTVLHRSPGNFILDGNDNLSTPLGLSAQVIERDYHISQGNKMRINNSLRCVREAPLDIEAAVFAPYATALVALSESARQAGCLLIDIGAGTTDYCLYKDDQPIVSGCIAVGGDHITNDIHTICGLSLDDAELVKITDGDAFLPPSRAVGLAKVPSAHGGEEVAIARSDLNKIIQARLVETLEIVQERLPEDLRTGLAGGVYLTGGTSLMRGIDGLVAQIFQSEARAIELPKEGKMSYFDDPRYYTVIGLIRYAQKADMERSIEEKPSLMKRFFQLFK